MSRLLLRLVDIRKLGARLQGLTVLPFTALLGAFIIFLPKGILGSFLERVRARR